MYKNRWKSLKNLLYIAFLIFKNMSYLLWKKDSLKFMKRLCSDFERFNITYIKIIQGLAANSFLFTDEQREYLIDYTQQIPYTEEEMDLELLKNLENDEIKFYNNKEPINSGIVAIVYKGSYRGKDVVIKILKNNIEEKLKSSLADLDFFTSLLDYVPFIRYLGLYNLFHVNQENILDQVYFDKEVATLIEWKKYSERVDKLTIPHCYEEFTKNYKKVIIMEFLESKSLLSLTDNEKLEYIYTFQTIIYSFAFFYGIGHCDLHAGNVLFQEDGKIGIIDLGITYKIDKMTQNSMFIFYKEAIVNSNIKKCMGELENLTEPKEILNKLDINKRNKLNEEIEKLILFHIVQEPNFMNFIYYTNIMLSKYNLKLSQGFSQVIFSLSSGISLSLALCHTSLLNTTLSSVEKEFNKVGLNVVRDLISEIDFSLD